MRISSNALVSALMITHGRPGFVLKAVEWFQLQTWQRKELVIVDDSTPDKRPDLSRVRGVRYVVPERPMHIGEKHDRAVEEAQGDVLTYWDDDDWFSPRRIVTQLEPIVLGRATITGIPRDLIVHAPGAQFAKFKPVKTKESLKTWIGNGNDGWAGNGWKPVYANFGFHDGCAMFSRHVLRHGSKHPPLKAGQKVEFLNSLVRKGEKVVVIPNEKLFIYVRHGLNTWNYVESRIEVPVSPPPWAPADAIAFWRKGVA